MLLRPRHSDQTTRQSSSTQKLSKQKKQPEPLQDSHATETTSNTSEHPPTRSHLLKPAQQIIAHVNGTNYPGAQRQLAQLQLQEDQEKLFVELDAFLEELELAAPMYVNETGQSAYSYEHTQTGNNESNADC